MQEMMQQQQEEEPMLRAPGQATTTFSKTVEDIELSKFYLASDLGKIYKQFVGKIYIRKKGLVQEKDPLMSEQGARRVIGFLQTYSDLNFRMNNYDEEEIRNIIRVFNHNFAGWFINNYEEFEVKEDEVRIIISIVTDFVEACLRKSMDEGERKFHRGTVQTREIVQNSPKQGRLSLGGLFK